MTNPSMRLAVLASLAAFAMPAVSLADDYRFEVRGAFDRDSTGSDSFGDVDILQVNADWYFAPVSTEGVPLAEAAFLGRASNLNVSAARIDILSTDLTALGAKVEYYIPNSIFFASVGVSRNQTLLALNSSMVVREYDTTWFGTLGVTPLDGLLVTTNFDEDGYDPNLTARYVGKLPNAHYYAGSVSVVDPDLDDVSLGVDFDYFFDDSTSVGAGYADGPDRLEVRAERFFASNWAAGVSVHTADGSDGFGVFIKWRR